MWHCGTLHILASGPADHRCWLSIQMTVIHQSTSAQIGTRLPSNCDASPSRPAPSGTISGSRPPPCTEGLHCSVFGH